MADKVSKSIAVNPLYQETSVRVVTGPPGPRGPQGIQGPVGPSGGASSDEALLIADPNFANIYVTTYTNGLVTQETWTDLATSYLRKRKDYTYSNGKIATIRIRIYSTNDGTTLDIDFTETLADRKSVV